MTDEEEVERRLRRARDEISIGPLPLDQVIREGRHRRIRNVLVPAVTVCALAIPVAVVGSSWWHNGAEDENATSERAPDPRKDCEVIPENINEQNVDMGDEAERRVEQLGRYLDQRFGEPPASLTSGLIGVAIEYAKGVYNVRVDPEQVPMADLQRELSAMSGPLTVHVIASCGTSKQLQEAGEEVMARVRIGSYDLNPYDSAWNVHLAPEGTAVGEDLEEQLGGLVRVTYTDNGFKRLDKR